MLLWLKVGIGIGFLYLFTKTTYAGAAIAAELRGCPAGTVPGPWPWSPCVPTCADGEFIAVSPGYTGIPAGTLFCAHRGGVSVLDELGNEIGGVSSGGTYWGVAADVDNPVSVQVGPVTSPHDPGGGL